MIDLKSIPSNPGCYLFKDNSQNILYIGKAKNIKKRVKTYFQKRVLDNKTKVLVSKIGDIDYFITNSETEAFILENNLIKKHRPKYNIDLKDSKGFSGILLTDESFPRIIIDRDRKEKGQFFGPFVSAQVRDDLIKFLTRGFKLRTCKRMPKRACIRFHIGICSAPCVDLIHKEEYTKRIGSVIDILNGKEKKVIKKLEEEMKKSSLENNFEKAIEYRDQFNAVSTLYEKQKVETNKKYDQDVINYILSKDKIYLSLFNMAKGVLVNKHDFTFDYSEEFFFEFLSRYYSDNCIPRKIIIPEKVDASLLDYLNKKRKGKVELRVPKKGVDKELLDLVYSNIEIIHFGEEKKLLSLKEKLRLNEYPKIIECFDISHIGGSLTAGSMVQFRDGIPDKNNYRRFRIRIKTNSDDYLALSEIIFRRYNKLKNDQSQMPELIIIDGGRGQLNAALQVLNSLELKIPTISISKRFEEIHIPGYNFPLRLKERDLALNLIKTIRDEAHRFAIKYHRLLRKKEMMK